MNDLDTAIGLSSAAAAARLQSDGYNEFRARKDDTRRKILAGAIVLARVAQGQIPEAEFRA